MSGKVTECSVEALNLFEAPLYQTAIKSSEWVEVKPITGIDRSTSTVKVYYQGKSGITVDLSRTIVTFTSKILKADGSALQATDQPATVAGGTAQQPASGATNPQPAAAAAHKVGVINYPVGSIFQSVDLELNGRNVCTSNNNYAHRAFLEILSSYSTGSKQTWLASSGYFDNTMTPESRPAGSKQNACLEKTAAMYGNGDTVTWSGRLHLDMCQQSRQIISNVNMMLTFVMNPHKYILQRVLGDTENYTFQIVDFNVKFLECSLSDAELMRIESQLVHSPALYPITRVDVRSFNMSAGITNFSEDNCFVGQLPTRIILAMVDDKAYTGTYDTSPFNYQMHGVDLIQLVVGGRAIPPLPLLPNRELARSNDEYLTMMAGIGNLFDDDNIGLTPLEWMSRGNTIFAFNMHPHMPADCIPPAAQGNVRVHLRFASALSKSVVLLLYAEYHNTVRIDKNRNVAPDF